MSTHLDQDPQITQSFQAYAELLGPINERSPQHQGFTEEEYLPAMQSPSVIKTEVEVNGEVVKVPQLAPVDSFEWLFDEYYQTHCPEEYDSGRLLHFTDFEGVEPGEEVKARVQQLAQEEGILVFDYPDSDPDYPDRIKSFLSGLGIETTDEPRLQHHDKRGREEPRTPTQTYYGGPVELRPGHIERETPISLKQAFDELVADGTIPESELTHGTTLETVIDGEDADIMHGFFAAAYDTIKDHPCAQALSPDEFRELMADESVYKIVYRNEKGKAESLCMLTTDLEGLTWVNADYYKKLYPEQYANEAVVWFPGIATNPDMEVSGRNLPKLVNLLAQLASYADYAPTVVFDTPDANKGFLDAYIESELAQGPYLDLKFKQLGMQKYGALKLQQAA